MPNFWIAASPASRTILAGTNASYYREVTGTSGFTESVALNVSGLPAGVTASFSPASIVGSGSSTLNVVTSVTTAAGTYPLTITGTTGAITGTATVNLVVTSSAGLRRNRDRFHRQHSRRNERVRGCGRGSHVELEQRGGRCFDGAAGAAGRDRYRHRGHRDLDGQQRLDAADRGPARRSSDDEGAISTRRTRRRRPCRSPG